MSTLSLKNRPVNNAPKTVPLEDWYEELADEDANPESILIAEEEELDNEEYYTTFGTTTKETTMTTNTIASMKPSVDVKSFLATMSALSNDEAAKQSKAYVTPAWLELKSGNVSEANAFTVTAGVIKSARRVLDAISFTQRQHEAAVEALAIQELRATRVTAEKHNFGPAISKVGAELAFKGGALDAPGFNPDGVEFNEALVAAQEEVEKLETILANGERIVGEILTWINDNAEDLNLRVETGYTTTLGPIGNEIRTPRYEQLTPETLMYGINAQREFIRSVR